MGDSSKNDNSQKLQAWVVSINMGLGHQRATYPLREIAHEDILLIGTPSVSSQQEIKLWTKLTHTYEFLSKIKKVPIIGEPLYGIVDRIQNIPPLYPLRDMSKPCFNNAIINRYIKRGLGETLMDKVKKEPFPFISSYPVPAMIADYYEHSRNYCIVCDAQINRAWVNSDPAKSKIMYMAPCGRSVHRLRQYGVPDERIFLTGFPLPKTLLGGPDLEILKHDLGQRLNYLDPNNRFWPLHGMNVEHFIGKKNMQPLKQRVLNITYAVGGAGAMKEVGLQIAGSLKPYIKNRELKVNLIAGVRKEVRDYFETGLKELGFSEGEVYVLYSDSIYDYFEKFNALMRITDILWTKPSELSFYAGLGLPVVMCPPLGSQEVYNRQWLIEIQAGIDEKDPRYTHQWLMHLLEQGRLAEAAWDGFLKARKYGTFKIEEILLTGTMKREKSPLLR